MAHVNVKTWDEAGQPDPRPCDWCGCPLRRRGVMRRATTGRQRYIHIHCFYCQRHCYREENRFYIQLFYDGDTDVVLPDGYEIVIPSSKG